MHPRNIRFDISSHCQLRCPGCPTGRREFESEQIKPSFTSIGSIEKFIKNHYWLDTIEISNWGEVFLNTEFKRILHILNSYRLRVFISNGVNLNKISTEDIEALIKYKVEHITVSIDGASQETYSAYRVGGDLKKVIDNIKKINTIKKLNGSAYPNLTWQFVTFKHNEHEREAARKMATDLGMYFKVKDDWSARDPSSLEAPSCHQLWNQPQIHSNGDVLGCCVNRTEIYGNVFKNSLTKIMKTEKYKNAKRAVQGLQVYSKNPCRNCSHYLWMKKTNSWFKPKSFTFGQDSRASHWLRKLKAKVLLTVQANK